jgi:hypothetical protein
VKIDAAIDKLNAAYKRLEEPQGRIARRNARQAFLNALRALRKGLDDEFPAMRKMVTSRKKHDPKRVLQGKERTSPGVHHQLLAAGVSPSQFVERSEAGKLDHRVYAPKWMVNAMKLKVDPKMIAGAVRSRKLRERIEVLVRLRGV